MRYFIEKVRNGCWRCVWEDGSYSEHSMKEGAEKAALLNPSHKLMTNNTLQNLQKEAREKYYRTFSSISPSTTDAYLDQLVAHVFTAAIEEARKALPKPGEDPGDFGGIDDKSVRDVWWGRYSLHAEADRKLKALLDK